MTAVFAGILLLLMAGGFFYLKIRVDRVVSGEEWIRKIRDEIDQLVLEMNQTAERNVALLEDRVKALQQLLDEADKKMRVMQKESEKSDLSRQVYSHLKHKHPVSGHPAGGEVHTLDLFESAANSTDRESHPAGTDNRKEPAARETAAAVKEPEAPHLSGGDLREKVMELYGQGFSADIISHKLGASVSEVDLIINLSTGAGG